MSSYLAGGGHHGFSNCGAHREHAFGGEAGGRYISLNNNAITRALAYAADQLGTCEWCEGASIKLADLALASALVYLDLCQTERGWRGAHPNLAAWFARMSGRASVRTTLAG